MKQLSTVSNNITSTVSEQVKKMLTAFDGYKTEDTKTIIPAKQHLQIKTSNSLTDQINQAKRIQSILSESKPKKSLQWIDGDGGKKQVEEIEQKDFTVEQIQWLREAQKPVSKAFIIDWLKRLTVHKQIQNDEKKALTLFVDMADLNYGVTEHCLILAIADIIENEKSEWFPKNYMLKEYINKHEITKFKIGE